MSFRSKVVYMLVVLIFALTSIAAGAFAAVQTAAHDFQHSDAAFHINGVLDSPAFSIAGEIDMGSGGGLGSG